MSMTPAQEIEALKSRNSVLQEVLEDVHKLIILEKYDEAIKLLRKVV